MGLIISEFQRFSGSVVFWLGDLIFVCLFDGSMVFWFCCFSVLCFLFVTLLGETISQLTQHLFGKSLKPPASFSFW